eukprot:scaffold332047_cov48-Prasinocladus_malaysianus.AAC.1
MRHTQFKLAITQTGIGSQPSSHKERGDLMCSRRVLKPRNVSAANAHINFEGNPRLIALTFFIIANGENNSNANFTTSMAMQHKRHQQREESTDKVFDSLKHEGKP